MVTKGTETTHTRKPQLVGTVEVYDECTFPPYKLLVPCAVCNASLMGEVVFPLVGRVGHTEIGVAVHRHCAGV